MRSGDAHPKTQRTSTLYREDQCKFDEMNTNEISWKDEEICDRLIIIKNKLMMTKRASTQRAAQTNILGKTPEGEESGEYDQNDRDDEKTQAELCLHVPDRMS